MIADPSVQHDLFLRRVGEGPGIPVDARLGVWRCFLLLGLLLPLNRISIHSYYRRHLSEVWINPVGRKGTRIPMEELNTVSRGGPYHIINSTLHLFGRVDESDPSPTQLFIFSPLFCGSYLTGFKSTTEYEGESDLANAMAISGAAVSPIVSNNPLIRVLLLMANFRLGQWVPNPRKRRDGRFEPAPLSVLSSAALWEPSRRDFCFVTDGGLRDNTGIETLLHRRCRVIVAVDASADNAYQFADLLKLIRSQRVEFGRQIVCSPYSDLTPLPDEFSASDGSEDDLAPHCRTSETKATRLFLEGLMPDKNTGLAKVHFIVAEIRYPQDRYSDDAGLGKNPIGYLIYVKPTFNDDEPADLVHFRRHETEFPHDPTYDQFFDDRKFECYRQLGEHIGDEVWEKLFKDSAEAAERLDKQERKLRMRQGMPGDTPWLSLWNPPRRKKPVPKDSEPGFSHGRQVSPEPLPPEDPPLSECPVIKTPAAENPPLAEVFSVGQAEPQLAVPTATLEIPKPDVLAILDQLVSSPVSELPEAEDRLRELGPLAFTEMDALLKSYVQAKKIKRGWAIKDLFLQFPRDAMPKLLDWLESKSRQVSRKEALDFIDKSMPYAVYVAFKDRAVPLLTTIANDENEADRVQKLAAKILAEFSPSHPGSPTEETSGNK